MIDIKHPTDVYLFVNGCFGVIFIIVIAIRREPGGREAGNECTRSRVK